MPRNATTGVFTRVSNSFSNPVFGTLIDPTDADAYFDDLDVGLNPPELDGPVRFINSIQVGTTGTAAGTIDFLNATSGSITLTPPVGALGTRTLILPVANDTLVGKATTDTLTNKTFDTAGAGNSLSINGVAVTANTGTGAVARASAPTFVTPVLGSASATNLAFSPSTGGIVGTATNDNANAGIVGEYVEGVVLSGSAISLTTNTAANLTSISLTAGDWDVDMVGQFVSAATTSATQYLASISATSATIETAVPGRFTSHNDAAFVNGGLTQSQSIMPIRVSISGTTTMYAVVRSIFTVSTMTCYGIIRARRVR